MRLALTYQDKYRLWNDLFRGSTDRLFIATGAEIELAAVVTVEINIPELSMPLVVKGTVVGQRPPSLRFERGVFVRIDDSELDRCRRFLRLRHPREATDRARRRTRITHRAKVRLLKPEIDSELATTNLSTSGMFVEGNLPVEAGQRLELELELMGEPLQLAASVAWVAPDRQAAGLELVDVSTPALERLQRVINRERERRADRSGRTIVVADDDPEISHMIVATLSKHGYEVLTATDGDEAVAMIRRHQPGLVILDVLLPGVDGAHICKAMRADADMMNIPVILVSALDKRALHQVAEETGASDYLVKPLHLGELLDLIGGYLRE